MNFIADNIRFLRKGKKLTQEAFANKIGVKRSLIGAYEEGRSEPRLATIQNIAHYFGVSLDTLINQALGDGYGQKEKVSGEKMRVLSVMVGEEGQERSILVPVKASAGYTNGYGDVDYIESLPHFKMPFPELSKERTYRLFQIKGDSMEPVPSGAYVICEYLHDWHNIKNDQCYVLLTRDEGLVYKRVMNKLDEGVFKLISDNPLYKPYTVDVKQIKEVWKSLGFVSFELPEKNRVSQADVKGIYQILEELKKEIENLKK